MEEKYVIKDVECKMYYYKFGGLKWSKDIYMSDYIDSKQQAKDIIKTLPKGIYKITKIYIVR